MCSKCIPFRRHHRSLIFTLQLGTQCLCWTAIKKSKTPRQRLSEFSLAGESIRFGLKTRSHLGRRFWLFFFAFDQLVLKAPVLLHMARFFFIPSVILPPKRHRCRRRLCGNAKTATGPMHRLAQGKARC